MLTSRRARRGPGATSSDFSLDLVILG